MDTVSRNRKTSSWVSRIPRRLKLFFSQPDNDEPREACRITHVPDRPTRSFTSRVLPTDEECLQYLQALQKQALDPPVRECRSIDSSMGSETSHLLHEIGGSGRDLEDIVGNFQSLPSRSDVERQWGWDTAGTMSPSARLTVNSPHPGIAWSPPRYSHCSQGGAAQSSAPTFSRGRIATDKGRAHGSLTRETWPTPNRPYSSSKEGDSKGALGPVESRTSLLPSPEAHCDRDSEADLYDGWAEYYFDETNFLGRDETGRFIGNTIPPDLTAGTEVAS